MIESRGACGPWCCVLLAVVSAGFVPAAQAAGFPPVTEEQKALQEVPGAPEAEAVILHAEGELWMMDVRNQRLNSTFRVTRRLKVLTPEGAETYGEIEIPHSRYVRLSNFDGRTVLPDGREMPVGKDAVFRSLSSRSERVFVTRAAFPNVEPGAILDWSYDISFDSIFYLEPWYFQADAPVLHSEVTYHIPNNLTVTPWGTSLPGKPFQQELQSEKDGRRLRVWLDNLPAIPDEPFSFPSEDLRARFMLVPKRMGSVADSVPLMETWKDVCKLIDEGIYIEVGRKAKSVKRLAKELEASAVREAPQGGRRAVAERLYRFVRDDIRTLSSGSVFPRDKTGLDDVLESGEGNNAEKALLLQSLLDAVKLGADLIWVPNRWDGAIDIGVPSPWWFEKAIVRVHIPFDGGEEIAFLDPSDPRLGFGHLNPTNEDVPALVYHTKNPETIVIPLSTASQNRRRATLDLALDEEGRLSGSGELELTGHHAWGRMSFGKDAEDIADAWEEWLAERWDGYAIDGVEVEEDRARRQVTVRWTLTQREEEVLGDEASIQLSRPVGPVSQIFQLDPERRKTPVLLRFPDVDEVEATVTWPETWEVDVAPQTVEVENPAGKSIATVTVDAEARKLTYSRNMTIARRQFNNSDEYRAVQEIYGTMEKSDAEALVLVAR